MRVRLLGTSAGGGFPQWNCRCRNCQGVRSGALRARPRTQSCVAVSADDGNWFLLNASPDIRVQIESFAPLLPDKGTRGSNVQAVLLTNADLDHTLGLFVIREGLPLCVYATASVRRALDEGLRLSPVLDRYCGIEWREPSPDLAPLRCRDGSPSGLLVSCVPRPGKSPRYLEDQAGIPSTGYRLVDQRTGGRLVFVPDLAALAGEALGQARDCDALLLDGTFWSDDEMRRAGVGETTAGKMGHLPVGGPAGSLPIIRNLRTPRKVYLHINNTNPMLIEDSPEHQEVVSAGVEIGYDGLELTL